MGRCSHREHIAELSHVDGAAGVDIKLGKDLDRLLHLVRAAGSPRQAPFAVELSNAVDPHLSFREDTAEVLRNRCRRLPRCSGARDGDAGLAQRDLGCTITLTLLRHERHGRVWRQRSCRAVKRT